MPTIFLDRDDTLTDTHGVTKDTARPGDLFDPAKLTLLPGVGEGLRALADAGFSFVVFTSQGAVARGPGGLREVEAVNQRLRDLLAGFGVRLKALYYCPFHPTGTVPRFTREHEWRKPAPGMIHAAVKELGIDLSTAWAIGDMGRDIEAAVNAGIPAERALRVGPEGRFAGLRDAAGHVLRAIGREPAGGR